MPRPLSRQLERYLARIDRMLERGSAASAWYTRWRLAIFVAGVLCTVLLYKFGWYHTGNATLTVFISLFAAVAGYHNRLETRLHRLRAWRRIKETHKARMALEWSAIPHHDIPVPEGHGYARDLDLIGPHSLLHLLDTAVSTVGRGRLADWLLNQRLNWPQWRERQALIRELSARTKLRDRIALEASLAGEAEIDGTRIRAALHAPMSIEGILPKLAAGTVLTVATLVLLLATLVGDFPAYWTLSFGAYTILYMAGSGDLAAVFGRAVSLHDELNKLGVIFRLLERWSPGASPHLAVLCAPLRQSPRPPSAAIRAVSRVCQALSVKAHPLIHLAVNALAPWDLYWTHRFIRVRQAIEAEIPLWLDTLAELEAACALGTFACLHPSYVWPTPCPDGAPLLQADAIGHPLIPGARRISNEIGLVGTGRILLVTGSNMSGKSTFLRTLGINACLAQAGAPVCANAFTWSWVRLACCIRVDDSLDSGLSFFYAEVKRLKQVLEQTQDHKEPPVFFLIDEIFKGTNNRERLIGSRAYIRALAAGNGFGLVTTHDLELADLEREISNVGNAHFQETVISGSLTFDYRLRPGPCPTTNALRIMAMEGLPVPEPENDPPPAL